MASDAVQELYAKPWRTTYRLSLESPIVVPGFWDTKQDAMAHIKGCKHGELIRVDRLIDELPETLVIVAVVVLGEWIFLEDC